MNFFIADDMGLGKTLTMIALILTTLAKDSDESDDNDATWEGSSLCKSFIEFYRIYNINKLLFCNFENICYFNSFKL